MGGREGAWYGSSRPLLPPPSLLPSLPPSHTRAPPHSPLTCGECGCEDSYVWYKEGDADKDCSWVAKNPDTRCDTEGDTGTSAADACLLSCDTCAPSVSPTPEPTKCVNDEDWHKAGDPNKGE